MSAVRGHLWPRDRTRRSARGVDPRRPRGRLQPRVHLPQGVRAQGAARGPGPGADAAHPATGRPLRGRELGRGVRRDRPAAVADPGRGPQRVSRSISAIRAPTTWRTCSTAGAAAGAGTRNIYSASTVDQFPKQLVECSDVRHRDDGGRPGRRPDRLPADAGREPARLQRQPDDGARHARTAAGDPGPRGQDRRHRPTPHADRRGGRRAPLHPPGHRRPPPVRRSSTCCSTRV